MNSEPSIESKSEALRIHLAEHRRKMAEDPEYRARLEASEAEMAATEEREQREWAERSARYDVECRRVSACIPKRVWTLLDAPQRTTALDAALAFVANPAETILVLAGGVGCGKTVAACAALDVAMKPKPNAQGWRPIGEKAHDSGRIVKAIDLARAGTFDREFWDDLTGVDVLVVDDLGTEPLDEKGWMLANIHALIDQRYDAALKTILTTNLNLDQFKTRYCADGGRLVDRLRECGGFLELSDASMRVVKP